MKATLAVAALEKAVALRQPTGPMIVHATAPAGSDHRQFPAALRRHELVGSMGRVPSAADNAGMESRFSLPQRNVLDRQWIWVSREELRLEILWWTMHTYNT